MEPELSLIHGIRTPGGNAIEYVTIATTGNASDFGDSLINAREYSDSASSDSHGGIS